MNRDPPGTPLMNINKQYRSNDERKYRMKMQDSNIESFSMDNDQLMAYVYAHMGVTAEARAVLKKLEAYDRLALGRYTLIQCGAELELSEEERKDAIRQGTKYYELWNKVGEMNYYAD